MNVLWKATDFFQNMLQKPIITEDIRASIFCQFSVLDRTVTVSCYRHFFIYLAYERPVATGYFTLNLWGHIWPIYASDLMLGQFTVQKGGKYSRDNRLKYDQNWSDAPFIIWSVEPLFETLFEPLLRYSYLSKLFNLPILMQHHVVRTIKAHVMQITCGN